MRPEAGTKLYIAGPMSGGIDFNFPIFHRAAEVLKGMGYFPLNPAVKESNRDGTPEWRKIPFEISCPTGRGQSPTATMQDIHSFDTKLIMESGGVVLLPGWMNSIGARAEAMLAQTCGRDLYQFSTDFDGNVVLDPVMVEFSVSVMEE